MKNLVYFLFKSALGGIQTHVTFRLKKTFSYNRAAWKMDTYGKFNVIGMRIHIVKSV